MMIIELDSNEVTYVDSRKTNINKLEECLVLSSCANIYCLPYIIYETSFENIFNNLQYTIEILMQMNNIDIYIHLMNSLDDRIDVDHVLQLMLIYKDKNYNEKLLVFLVVFPEMIFLKSLVVLKNPHQIHTNTNQKKLPKNNKYL